MFRNTSTIEMWQNVISAPPGLGFLSAYISMPCDETFGWCKESYQREIGLKRRRARTFGYINDGGPYYFFQSWKPRCWNNFCTVVDSSRQVYRTTINEELVYENHQYSGVHKGRVQKFMLGKLMDFSIKWVGGVPLVH